MADTIGLTPDQLRQQIEVQGMGESSKALSYGARQAGSNLLSAAAAATQIAGAPNLSQLLNQEAQTVNKAADAYRPDILSPGDVKGVGDVPRFLANAILTQAPQLAASVVGGTVGGLAGGPVGAGLGLLATSIPFNAGDVYQETGDAKTAFAAALPMSALDIIPELGAATKIAHGAVAPSLKTFAKDVFTTGLKEGVTEAGQEAIQIGAGVYSGKQYDSSEITQRLLDSAITGAAVGSAFPAAVEGVGRARKLIGRATGTSEAQDFGSSKAQELGSDLAAKYALPPAAENAPTIQLGAGDVGTLNEALATGNARPGVINVPTIPPYAAEGLAAPTVDLFGNVVETPTAAPAELPTAQAPTSDYANFASEYLARKPDATFSEIDQMYRGVAARRLEAAAPELRSQEARSRQAALDLGQYDITPQGAPLQLEESPLTRSRPQDFASSPVARTSIQDFAGEKLKGAGWRYATKAIEGAQTLDEAMTKLRTWTEQVGDDKSVAPAKAQAMTILERYDQQKATVQQPQVTAPAQQVAPEVQAQVQAATPALPQAVEKANAPMAAAPKAEPHIDFNEQGRSVDQNPQTAGETAAKTDVFAGIAQKTYLQERSAFGKAVYAVVGAGGNYLYARKNNKAAKAIAKGDVSSALSALAESKSPIVRHIAELAAVKKNLKMAIDPTALETRRTYASMVSGDAALQLAIAEAGRKAISDGTDLSGNIPSALRNTVLLTAEELRKTGLDPHAIRDLRVGDQYSWNAPASEFLADLNSAENYIARNGEDTVRNAATGAILHTAVAGSYDSKAHTVFIASEYDAANEHTVTHELAHAVLSDIIAKPTSDQRPVVARLDALRKHLLDALPEAERDYGLTSVQEFVAEGLSNPDFQQRMSTVPYQSGTIWGKFTSFLAQLLDVKNNNAFIELVALTEQLSQVPNITAAEKVAVHLDAVMKRGDAVAKALGRRLKQIAGDTPVVFVDNPAAYGLPAAFSENYGGYDEVARTIYINRALAEADGKFDETLFHETTHAATVQWVQKARENPTAQDTQILGELDKLRQQIAAAHPDDEGVAAATSSVEELLAYGLTNRDFQSIMKAINEPSGTGIRDLFTKFAQLLRKALGIPDGQATAFSKFIDLSSLVLDGEAARVNPNLTAAELGKTGDLFWAKKVAFAADAMQNMDEQQGKYVGHLSELAASIKEYLQSKASKLKSEAGFAVEAADMLSENALVERFGKQFPELNDYQKRRVEQDVFQNKFLSKNEKWASEFSRLSTEEQQSFGKLAIDVTTANVSPLKGWDEHTWINPEEKTAAHQAWKDARTKLMIWKRDKPKLYDAYVNGQKNIKEVYNASYEELQNLMRRLSGFETKAEWDTYAAQIVKEGKDKTDPLYQSTKGKLDNASKAMRTIKGDYWPLRRDGNYVIMYEKGENGKPGYENGVQFAESEVEAERIANDLANDGYTVGKDYKTDRRYNSSSGVPAVVTELVNAIDSNKDLEADQREALKDTVYRSYIRTMGDESISAKLRRKNVAGASTDMLRAVSSYLTGSVAQTAKLKYDHQIYKVIDEGNRKYAAKRLADGSLRTDAEGNPIVGDPNWGKIRNSLMRRVVENGAETSPFIHSLTQAAHTYYLGFSPAFLITNMTQPFMVGWPRMAAQFGAVKSAAALAKATGRAAKLLGAIGAELGKGEDNFLARLKAISDPQSMFSPDNMEFFKQHGFDKSDVELLLKLQDYGVIDFTQASSLLGYARGENTNSKLNTIAKVAGTFGHYSEMINRLAVAFAQKELLLGKNPNTSVDTLVQSIKEANDKTNLDYTQRNRAPAFSHKGFLGKLTPLVLQFQQYSFQMMEGIYLNAWKALSPTFSPEERKVAARTMLYSALSTGALAGALGLPFTTAVAGVINAIANIFKDDNEPFDIRTELRNHLYDLFGETGQRMLTDGLFSAIGVNIQDRAGLQDILPFSQVIAADTSLQQAMQKEAQGVWGPAGQMVLNGSNAVGKLFNGDFIGAFRVGSPTALKNLVKAYEANQTKHFIAVDGSPLPVQANMADAAFMALGFTPADLAAYRQGKGRASDVQRVMSEKRAYLTDEYMRAVLAKDEDKAHSVISDIQEFNAANPTFAIKLADVRRLQMSFNKLQRGGLPLPPTSKQRALLQELRFAQIQPEEEQ